MIIKTGDRFTAETKIPPLKEYTFVGLDLASETGCDYIVLQNADGKLIYVKAAWFREDICGRKITPLGKEGVT